MKHHIQLLLLRTNILRHPLHIRRIGTLSHSHRIILLQYRIHFAQELRHSWAIAVLVSSKLPLRRRVGDRCVEHFTLGVHVDSVDAESVDPALEPEFHGGFVDGLPGFGVFPVEVGLFGAEEVEVVFFCLGAAKELVSKMI